MKIIKFIGIFILGAVLSRLHGAGWLVKSVMSTLWALPFAALPAWYFWPDPYALLAIPCLALCALGKSTSHGQWYSLATVWKYIEPERMDFVIKWFFGEDPRSKIGKSVKPIYREIRMNRLYWRCVAGMALKGFLAVSCAVISFSFINPLFSVIHPCFFKRHTKRAVMDEENPTNSLIMIVNAFDFVCHFAAFLYLPPTFSPFSATAPSGWRCSFISAFSSFA